MHSLLLNTLPDSAWRKDHDTKVERFPSFDYLTTPLFPICPGDRTWKEGGLA